LIPVNAEHAAGPIICLPNGGHSAARRSSPATELPYV